MALWLVCERWAVFKERFREGAGSRTRCRVKLKPFLAWKPFFYFSVQGRCHFFTFLWVVKLQTIWQTAGGASDHRPTPTSAFTHRMLLLLEMWLFYTHQSPSFLSTLYVPEPTEVVLIGRLLFWFACFVILIELSEGYTIKRCKIARINRFKGARFCAFRRAYSAGRAPVKTKSLDILKCSNVLEFNLLSNCFLVWFCI